jgi:alpha-beta hydrolase superfamily lysophospholipase
MSKSSECFFRGPDENQLFYQIWKPSVPAKGSIVITHGQAEHSDCYDRLARELSDLPWTIYAWDFRGHGRSEGQRGYVADFQDYVRDFESFLAHLEKDHQVTAKNRVLLAHSMGGLIQTSYLLQKYQSVALAQVLSNPMWGLAVDVPIIKDLAAFAVWKIFPQVTLNNEIEWSNLTSDQDVIADYKKDVLRHDRISAGAYLGSIMAMENLKNKIHKINIPTLLQISPEDPVCDAKKGKEFFTQIAASEKLIKEYPKSKHEIYNDIERSQAIADLKEWLKSVKIA